MQGGPHIIQLRVLNNAILQHGSFVHSFIFFIHSFFKYLLSANYVPGSCRCWEYSDEQNIKKKKNLCPHGAYILVPQKESLAKI